MKLQRSIVLPVLALILGAATLYGLKGEADRTRQRVAELQRQTEADRRVIRTLRAEVAFRERADRIETAARDTLGLAPVETARRIRADELAVRLQPPAAKVAAP